MKNIKNNKLQIELPIENERFNSNNERQMVIKMLNNMSRSRLVAGFLVEMDIKNKAYFFMVDNNLFDKFTAYCKKNFR
ncbi:MAG TPA: hypothetical protein VFC67_22090 [Prolixibacteraceae bacterium]|nr:hypothetical protein [Prolixibacteraceae bacterium]